jgi:LmbE family N-acetylglucosaminyl deacetylase
MSWDLVVLSPHLDDAAFSCGGLIARATARGGRVLVLSLCTADADPATLSPYARALHQQWGLGDAPYAARRAEDVASCAVLGAEWRHAGLQDAIYRRAADGQPLYPDAKALFGRPATDDQALGAAAAAIVGLAANLGGGLLVAPLAIGGHVDHRLVRQAAERVGVGRRLVYYEDFPYARSRRQRWKALLRPVPQSLRRLSKWRSRRVELGAMELEKKIAAASAHISQLYPVFADSGALSAAIRGFADFRGGERFWCSDVCIDINTWFD